MERIAYRRTLDRNRARFWFAALAVAAYLTGTPVKEASAGETSSEAEAAAELASEPADESPWKSIAQTWDNIQKQLNSRGIGFSIRYDGEFFSEISGGLRRGATYLGNLNLQLTVDAQRLAGWPGANVFLYGLGIHGGRPSGTFAGDAQGISNIEGPSKWVLEEAWIQQTLLDNRFSMLIGRYDLNSEFYRLQSANLFLNSSFGIGPEFAQSGQGGPSIFPNTSVGARFAIKPVEEIVLRSAILDGVPVDRAEGTRRVFVKKDGVLLVGEAAYLYRPVGPEQPRTRQFRIGRDCCGTYTGKLAAGAWYYSATFDDLTQVRANGQPARRGGNGGFYLLADQTVYQDTQEPDRHASLFGQFGMSAPRINRFAYYTGAGLTFSAPIPGRNQDEVGFAIAAAHNGSPFIRAQRNQGIPQQRSEVAFELTYLAQFGAHLAVQPDFQFVLNPNTNPRIKNALVFFLRFEISL